MKIIFEDTTEAIVDKLEDALVPLVNVHTYIWDGICKDTYRYVIEIDEDIKKVDDREYTLEHVDVLYKSGYYFLEIMNARQVSTIDIKKNEVKTIAIM